MRKYECRTIGMIVVPVGEPIFSEMATKVSIVDEAGGEYIEVSQEGRGGDFGKIAICAEEWPSLRDTIDQMIAQCRP